MGQWEVIYQILGVQRHDYYSDFKLSLYLITYYKVTSLYSIFFFLSSLIQEKTGENRVLHDPNDTKISIHFSGG